TTKPSGPVARSASATSAPTPSATLSRGTLRASAIRAKGAGQGGGGPNQTTPPASTSPAADGQPTMAPGLVRCTLRTQTAHTTRRFMTTSGPNAAAFAARQTLIASSRLVVASLPGTLSGAIAPVKTRGLCGPTNRLQR